jgi:hypothetical protein
MSGATSGRSLTAGARDPGFRYAHPGFDCSRPVTVIDLARHFLQCIRYIAKKARVSWKLKGRPRRILKASVVEVNPCLSVDENATWIVRFV